MRQEYSKGKAAYGCILALSYENDSFQFDSSITETRTCTQNEIEKLEENIQSLKQLKPDGDRTDYALAASSGALCGIIDIFLTGVPGNSGIGSKTDEWVMARTKAFASQICKWDGNGDPIYFLEQKFRVPYDQRGAGDAGSIIYGLNPSNHHFKSLGHNPTILGLFFSIVDQFTDQSHFVSDGKLISLQEADHTFALYGGNLPGKIFSGFVNWFGHLISDASGLFQWFFCIFLVGLLQSVRKCDGRENAPGFARNILPP